MASKNYDEMAKNGLLVIRDFYEDSKFGENGKFGKKTWKVWTKFNEMAKKVTLAITDFSKKANFCQKWWILQKLIKRLAKTPKWVDKKKACENLGTSWNWTSCGPWSDSILFTPILPTLPS